MYRFLAPFFYKSENLLFRSPIVFSVRNYVGKEFGNNNKYGGNNSSISGTVKNNEYGINFIRSILIYLAFRYSPILYCSIFLFHFKFI